MARRRGFTRHHWALLMLASCGGVAGIWWLRLIDKQESALQMSPTNEQIQGETEQKAPMPLQPVSTAPKAAVFRQTPQEAPHALKVEAVMSSGEETQRQAQKGDGPIAATDAFNSAPKQEAGGFPDDLSIWDNFCDSELVPTYELNAWKDEHGKELPGHPAIFRGHDSREGRELYGTMKKFVDAFGNEEFPHPPKPEWGNPGGFGAHVQNRAERRMNVRTLTQKMTKEHLYFSQFSCREGSFCSKVWPSLGVPSLFDGPTESWNFLIGGRESGLPLHSHGKTWQGLLSGRKVWFLIPPDRTSMELHDLTGPYLFPVRGWAKMVHDLPLGKRPLICVQRPGDIFYFPDEWLHGTLNLDEFQLAWGGKPIGRPEEGGARALINIFEAFPKSVNQHSMPYSLSSKVHQFLSTCARDLDKATQALEAPFKTMTEFAYHARDVVHNTALLDNTAFAYCSLAERILKDGRNCPEAARKVRSRWRLQAKKLSPQVYAAECIPYGSD